MFRLIFILTFTLCFNLMAAPRVMPYMRGGTGEAPYRLNIQEVLKITDEQGNFNLKRPIQVAMDEEGNIYVLDDGISQILKFGPQGCFLKSLVKKGEGPGEVYYMQSMLVTHRHLIVNNGYPAKMIFFDHNGMVTHEYKLRGEASIRMVAYDGQAFFGLESMFPREKINQGYLNVEQKLVLFSPRQQDKRVVFSFPIRRYYVRRGGARGMFAMARMLYSASMKHHCIWISHTDEYNIKCIDLKSGKTKYRIARDYRRQPFTREDKAESSFIILNGKKFFPPMQKYKHDLVRLAAHDNHLWAFTSSADPGKGVLVDRYDLQGQLVDQFYLKCSYAVDYYRRPYFWIFRNSLLSIEQDEDENPMIVKYLIRQR